MPAEPIYQPGASSVEGSPTALQLFHAHPPSDGDAALACAGGGELHHAAALCIIRMNDHDIRRSRPATCASSGAASRIRWMNPRKIRSTQVPICRLCYFFRLRLPAEISSRLMKGSTLLTSATDAADKENFCPLVPLREFGQSGKGAACRRRVVAPYRAHRIRTLFDDGRRLAVER